MNNKKIKNYLVSVGIILLILFLLFFNYYYFILSPSMIEANKVENIIQLFEENNDLDVEYQSHYYMDEQYYAAYDSKNYYIFNEFGRLLETVEKSKVNFDLVDQIANKQFDKYTISLGLYEEQLVYVINTEKYDIFINEQLEEVLRFRKGALKWLI